jgi:hypothetical protein
MNKQEQAAFVEAFGSNVSGIDDAIVADFIRRYTSGEDINYSSDYTPIMDALGMWCSAIKWQMEQTKEALTLSLAELHRHATDTESGERAIEEVERVLK